MARTKNIPLNGYKLRHVHTEEYMRFRRNKKTSFAKVKIGDILFSVRDRIICKVYEINKDTILAQTNIYDAADNENLIFSKLDFANELVLKSNTQELVEYLKKYGTTKQGRVSISPQDGVAFTYDRTSLNAASTPKYLDELFANACYENKENWAQSTFNSFQFSFNIDRPKYKGLPYGKTYLVELVEEGVSDEGIFKYEDIKVGDIVEYDSRNFVVLKKGSQAVVIKSNDKYGDIHHIGDEARMGIFRKPKNGMGYLGEKNIVSHRSVKAGDIVYYIPESRVCTVAYKDPTTRLVKLKSEDGQHYFLMKSDFDNGDVLKAGGKLKGIDNVAAIAANAYVQKARIDYEKSLSPEERKQLSEQRTNNLTKGAMFLLGAGIGFAVGKFI